MQKILKLKIATLTSLLLIFSFSNIVFSQQQLNAHCGQDKTVCIGGTTTIGGNPTTGGTPPYTYLWTPSTGLSCTNCSNPTVTGSVNTRYTLTVTDASNNTDDCQIDVTVYQASINPDFNYTPSTCSNLAVQFTNTTGNNNNHTYSWDFGNPTSGSSNTSTLINPLHIFTPTYGNGSNSYNVTLTVTNGNGCFSKITKVVTVLQIPDASLSDYEDNTPFVNCGGSNFLLTVNNSSSTESTNANYKINWGNGNPNYNSSNFASTTQNYTSQGYFTIVNTVTGQNGCVNSKNYLVFNGSNPSIGFSNPGGTVNLCVPHSLTFPITNTAGNPPGTIYTITTNTGDPAVTYSHPPPSDYTHVFTTSSCGKTGATTPNSFYVRIKAENPCGFSQSTIEPITTSIKPIANFSISPDTIDCINTVVTFTNTSIAGVTVDNFGVCSTTTLNNWVVSPSNGWNISNGSLGNQNPSNNPNTWGSNSLGVTFTTAGTYSISMIVRNPCGNDTIIKQVCIQSPPTTSFTVTPITGCSPLVVNFTNTSTNISNCGTITRLWTVTKTGATCIADSTSDYRFISGTNSSSENPIIRFNNQGTYNVTLSLTNKCGTFTTTPKIITVKRKPQVSISVPANICLGDIINPTATATNCANNTLTYLWTFSGGTPSTSTLAVPPSVSFASTGNHSVSLAVTNECGTTTVSSNVNVLATPIANAGLDVQFCSGNSAVLGTSSTSGLTYSWSSSTGLSSNSVSNPTVTLFNTSSSPISSIYTVTVTNAANCFSSDQVNVTVNPKPIVSVTSQAICAGQIASLTASGANTYQWTLPISSSNPLTISPTTTTNYTVTGTSSATGCTNTATGVVTVNPLPIVNAGPSIQVCNQPIANTLTGYSPPGGSWSGTNVTSNGVFTPSGLGNYILTYSYTNQSTSCVNSDTMIVTVISPQISNAGTGFSKCLNSGNITLTGYSPLTGIWSGTGVSGNVFSPTTVGSNVLTYTVGSGTCLSTDTIHIQVNTLPVVTVTSQTICSGKTATLTASGADTYQWTLPASSSNPLTISPTTSTNYPVTGTSSATGCTNTAIGVVTVNPLPIVNAGPSIQLCNQPIANTLTGYSPTGGVWSGTNVTSNGVFTPSGLGNYILTYSYTNQSTSCVNSDTMIVTVISPQISNAGTGFSKCLNSGNITLTGYSPLTGIWSGTGVNGNVFSPTTLGSSVLTYTVGSGTCLSTDTIHIQVNPLPVVTVTSQTICSGKTATLTASGADTYQWISPSSSNNPLIISPTTTTNYTVTGTSSVTSCSNSATGLVTVNPLPIVNAGPSIQLCNQPISNTLTGYSPSGGVWSGANVTTGGVFTPSGLGSFILKYTYTDPITFCVNSDTMTITVISPQISNAGSGFTKCLNSGNISLTGYTPLTGIWSGTGVSGNVFSPTVVGTTVLTYTVGSGTCLSTDTIHIQVNPLPLITVTSQIICAGETAILTASGADTYQWTSPSSSSNQISISPTTNTNYIATGTSSTTGCSNSATGVVTVNPLPIVNAGPSIQLCNQPISNTLTGYSPSGGVWSGANVTTGGVFTPSGLGSFILKYTYTDPITFCVNSDTMTITVISPEIADAGNGFSICFNSLDVALTGYSPTNGTWTGSGVNGNVFSPSVIGNSILTYSVGSGTCLSTDTIHIKVNRLPDVIVSSQTICLGQSAILTASGADTYQWTSPTSANNQITISPTITTNYIVTGTALITGCSNSATGVVTVNPLPIVNAGPSIQLCNQPIANTLTGYSPSGGIWSGTNVTSGGIFTPSTLGDIILTYTYTDLIYGCTNFDTMKISIVNPEIAIAGNDQSICLNNNELNLTGFSPLTGIWTGVGITSPNGVFDPLISGVGSFDLTLSYGTGTCFVTDTKNVIVLPLPTVSAGQDKVFCNKDNSEFFIGTPNTGTWSGNGIVNSTSGEFDPDIAGVGVHQIIYSVIDPSTLCVNTDTLIATVNPLPTVNFNFNPIACINSPQVFTNTSLNSTTPYWIFENVNTSSDLNPIYTFSSIGLFPVKLIETTIYGCKDSITQIVEVREPPVSNFSISSDSICGPATISFTNNSTGLFNSFSWDFGNNTFSSLMNPSPVVYQQGTIQDTTYFITLNVTNFCGNSSQIIPLKVMPSPKSIFGTHIDSGCSPLLINFTNNSLGLPDITTWNYGDGSSSINFNQNSTHTYTTSTNDTTFVIQLIATNECGTDTSEYSILVHPNTVNAFFNTNQVSGCSPLSVDFTNFSTNNIFYNWDFGDGNNSTLLNPSHTFSPGNYTVALYINNGCSYDTAYVDITAFPIQNLDFTYAPDSICINKPFIFTNLSTNLASSTWDFGDGNTSILTNPSHSYSASGTYIVNLVGISSTNGCISQISHEVKVKSTPISNFTTSLNNGCIPLPISFNSSSINSDFEYWDFGDGNTSNTINPIHIYNTAGTYSIKQVSVNLNGCRDSISHLIIAHPLPISNFTITESNVCLSPLIVTTSNTSSGAISYTWDFNNGTNPSYLNNPVATYPNSGNYSISLISENVFHCKDTSVLDLNISPILDVSFTLKDDTICKNEVLIFNSNVNFGDSIVWDFGNGIIKAGNPVWYVFPDPGVFDITAIAYANNGCTDTSSISEIVILPSPIADFLSSNVEIDGKPSGTIEFTNISQLATNYIWDFGDGNSSTDIDPIYKYIHNSNATVTLYAINDYGCIDTSTQIVEVDFFHGLFIPSTMYPGHEEFGVANFVPIGVGIKEFEILVYDDWGNIIWQSTALDEDGRPSEYWNGLNDGTVNINGNGSGRPVQQDSYVWKATATFLDGSIWQGNSFGKNKFKRNGTITVIR